MYYKYSTGQLDQNIYFRHRYSCQDELIFKTLFSFPPISPCSTNHMKMSSFVIKCISIHDASRQREIVYSVPIKKISWYNNSSIRSVPRFAINSIQTFNCVRCSIYSGFYWNFPIMEFANLPNCLRGHSLSNGVTNKILRFYQTKVSLCLVFSIKNWATILKGRYFIFY